MENNKTANKNRITVHTLRHTHASWLAQSSVNILHIKEQLGHKKIKTTHRNDSIVQNRNSLISRFREKP
ncbi:tyrosine-type recombinase/integrase [Arcobacter sp.]|uniref:tyrosine-type recombinase/integrase n=1 Tax=Arcobacter sp. TaxID=1872629 RepID=UPI003C727A47